MALIFGCSFALFYFIIIMTEFTHYFSISDIQFIIIKFHMLFPYQNSVILLHSDSPIRGQPIKIEQNQIDQNKSQFPIKITSYNYYLFRQIRNISKKYVDVITNQQLQFMMTQMENIRKESERTRGTRQLAALAFLIAFPDLIRVSLKDYCLCNQLNAKLFNRKYKIYYQLNRQKAVLEQENLMVCDRIKIQQIQTQQKKNEEVLLLQKNMEQQQENQIVQVNSFKEAIQLIFDIILKNNQFQDKRKELIQAIAGECQKVDPAIFDSMPWAQNYCQKLFYILFSFLRQLKFKIMFKDYKKAVWEYTGNNLNYSYINKSFISKCCTFLQKKAGQQIREETELNPTQYD